MVMMMHPVLMNSYVSLFDFVPIVQGGWLEGVGEWGTRTCGWEGVGVQDILLIQILEI